MTKREGRNTEVNAYRFILNDLETLGWNIKSPAQSGNGQVYTQRQCLDDPRIKVQLGGEHPENVVKLLEDEFYVIEAKHERSEIGIALSEAENDYANKINKNKQIKARIISGVAGNERDGYIVKSKFLEGNDYKTIKVNGHELTSLVSPKIASLLIQNNKAEIRELPADEKEFLRIAERINSILHEGAISADNRGSVMASLILTFLESSPIDINQETPVLVASINAKVDAVLRRSGKPDFYPFLEIKLPRSTTNHFKFKGALVDTLKELRNLNIPSAMNSGDDILGKFFEVFLKYGNWAKDVGIVFTPRHITKFATEVLDITPSDIVYDPTCGTGGFLVGAFDHVKNKYPSKIEVFRKNNMFGTEYPDGVIALAIVNMIFRNDGKTNLEGADCFSKWLNQKRSGQIETAEYLDTDKQTRIPPVTKVLMNPPFAQPTSENKEYKFIDHALKQMTENGILFSILPTGVMVKQGQFCHWRRDSLLRENTLIAVIDFPEDLFYPVGVVTCGIIVKKGVPHPEGQKVLWIKITEDGFLKSKGKRLPSNRTKNQLEEVKELVKSFIKDQKMDVHNIKEFQKSCVIDLSDPLLELLPEVYLDEKIPSEDEIKEGIDNLIRETVAFKIKTGD